MSIAPDEKKRYKITILQYMYLHYITGPSTLNENENKIKIPGTQMA